jgi:Flp pilus assembly protein TadD
LAEDTGLFQILRLSAVAYGFLAGFRTLTEYDLGWQLATARWIVEHRQIPSTDVFSYTAFEHPWIYPIGAGLIFYGLYVIGKYQLLSWLHASVSAATVTVLLRGGSAISAVLAILAVPLIAIRTRPRADMFTVILFAAFLVLLWRQHQGRRVRLWLLPLLMAAWVNLHLGFAAGLALVATYVALEAAEIPWPDRRAAAMDRLRHAWPWLAITVVASFANPWGWGIYRALFRQDMATAFQSQRITEWAPARINWTTLPPGLSLRNPTAAFELLLLIAAIAVLAAAWRKQFGAAVLICAAAGLAIRHVRFEALFAIIVVVAGGAVLTAAFAALPRRFKEARGGFSSRARIGAAAFVIALVGLRSLDLVDDRNYLSSTDLGSFAAGLSWWFPERAAAFVVRERLPGRIFNSYNEGGYLTWRLGPEYPDYIDGRAIPFGARLFDRNGRLMATPPESPEWQKEAERFDINTILVPLGRFNGLNLFPVLRQFCDNNIWIPVYLDEVSAVFVRSTHATESLIKRLRIDCASVALPVSISKSSRTKEFNEWANAAALLNALGRRAEAFASSSRALTIFQDNAFVHFIRGDLLLEAGEFRAAEAEYRSSAALEENGTTWSRLASLYRREGRLKEEVDAWERAGGLLPYPAPELVALGYAEIGLDEPRKALAAFDKAVASLPPGAAITDNAVLPDVAHGRAMAWSLAGDLGRAISYEEEAVRLRPQRADAWLDLANLYDRQQRFADARQARERAAAIMAGKQP